MQGEQGVQANGRGKAHQTLQRHKPVDSQPTRIYA